MRILLKRTYATISNEAAAARTASTPRAVRIRRARRAAAGTASDGPTLPGSDALASGMTPSEYTSYVREKAHTKVGRMPSQKEWLAKAGAHRARLRGYRQVVVQVPASDEQADADATTTETTTTATKTKTTTVLDPVGERVYLPNFTIRMVRNHTPKGEPYNPYEATFRIPQSLTKNDVRNYLWSVYGVATTYVRTDNYIAPFVRRPHGLVREQTHKTYKRAVVGLVEPFYYPDAPEDMSAEERKAYDERAERMYGVQERKDTVRELLLRRTKKNSDNWRWNGPLTTRRGTILRLIAERRAARAEEIERTKAAILEARKDAAKLSESATQ